MADKQKSNAVAKRKITQNLKSIANQIPDEWASNDEAKLSLVKSIHTDILGKDKDGNARPLKDLRYFMFQASQRGLNPFKNQIHGLYIWDSSIKAEKLVIVTGIDGFTSIAQRTGRFAGFSETRFGEKNEDGFPENAVVDMYAYNPKTGVRELVTTATAWWDEYVKLVDEFEVDENGKKIWDGKGYKKTGNKVVNSMWRSRPRGQLEKCAQALAIRRMFPDEVGGMYVYEEVDHLQPTKEQLDSVDSEEQQRERINKAIENRRKNGGIVKDVKEGEVVRKSTDDKTTKAPSGQTPATDGDDRPAPRPDAPTPSE